VSRQYSVYIMTNVSRTLCVGVTNDLVRRIHEHKEKLVPGFTSKYNITQLVWYEHFQNPCYAISREKQLKGWRREKKLALIHSLNPTWQDLSGEEPERPFDSAQGNKGKGVIPSESDESRNLSDRRPFDSAQGDAKVN